MALWKYNGCGHVMVPFNAPPHNGVALLMGTGKSLNTISDDDIPGNVVKFGLNHSFRAIRPDIFLALDEPAYFGKDVAEAPYIKVFRGNHADVLVDGIASKKYFNTYFADMEVGNREKVFSFNGIETKFWWNKSTFYFALHFIYWMGFRKIAFIGVDMKGDYFDSRTLSVEEEKDNRNYLEQNFEFMKWYAEAAGNFGMKLVTCSKDSRLNEIMSYMDIKSIGAL